MECVAVRQVTLDGVVDELAQRVPRLVLHVREQPQHPHTRSNADLVCPARLSPRPRRRLVAPLILDRASDNLCHGDTIHVATPRLSDRSRARARPGPALSARMSVLGRRNTSPELALRRELHRRGLRYRVQVPVPGNRRRTIDIAFTQGSSSPSSSTAASGTVARSTASSPRTNAEWWRWKLERNAGAGRATRPTAGVAGVDGAAVLGARARPERSADTVTQQWRDSAPLD